MTVEVSKVSINYVSEYRDVSLSKVSINFVSGSSTLSVSKVSINFVYEANETPRRRGFMSFAPG